MDPMEAIRATFFEECAELLEVLEAGLLTLQDGTQDPDTIDAVFRAVHSIKGGAGAFDLGPLVAYAHEFETALAALRSGRLRPDGPVLAVFLAACDRLGDLVAAARSGARIAATDATDLAALIADASALEAPGRGDPFVAVKIDFGLDLPVESERAAAPGQEGRRRSWNITFEPLPDLLTSGNEPLHLFRGLEVLGHIEASVLDGDLASLTDMDVKVPRLRWRILLDPSAPDLTETEIEAVFEFAVDLCVLTIAPTADEGETAPIASQAASKASPPLSGEARERASSETAPPRSPAAIAQPANPAPPATIRVDIARVDRLVNLVGELVISQSMLAQGMARAGLDQHSDAVSTLDELQQLTRDLQDGVMAIRAQPVKSLFQRMTRIVREAAQATGKDVRLETQGEGTEIDKTVVERLAEPLTHMIRNAIDHGLEDPSARAAAGKPATGTVRLAARQQSDRVVIEISDDGRGIDRERVLRRGISCGLVPADATPEIAEIDRLLFMPGFSTSETVSALSGRGVGMDVVQRAIRDLNGTISIASEPGVGCRFSISLPLTLAILDGMIVRSRRQRMVIPLSAIIETQTYSAARVETIGAGKAIVRLHERFVPMVDLARGMGFAADPEDAFHGEDCALLFVQPDEGGPYALRVDAIEAQRQVVVKGLGDSFGHVPCVSAATILGDGQVALIVDPAGIASLSGLAAMPVTRTPEMLIQ